MPCLVAGSKPASQLLLNINRQTYETPVFVFHNSFGCGFSYFDDYLFFRLLQRKSNSKMALFIWRTIETKALRAGGKMRRPQSEAQVTDREVFRSGFFCSALLSIALTSPLHRGVSRFPSEDHSHGRAPLRGLFLCRATDRRRTAEHKKKDHENQDTKPQDRAQEPIRTVEHTKHQRSSGEERQSTAD